MKLVFRPLVEAAKQARAQIAAEFTGLKGTLGSVYRSLLDEALRAGAKLTTGEETQAEKRVRSAKSEAERKIREHQRAHEHVFQIKQRYLAQEERAERESHRRREAASSRMAENTGYWSIRHMDRAMRGAGRFGMNLARGAGVNMDLGSLVGQNVELGKTAQ